MSKRKEQDGVDAEASQGEIWGAQGGFGVKLYINITPDGLPGGHIYLVMLSAPTGSDIITCSALDSK